ncbi:GNAT family N-acetyltransferase [Taibaiella chishuiensis]|uniref:Acetyltransferase (GNAT) family protein n=1 Tax=Taibaiella chishuiensis TaxID=1434707 RepID=A0A2P8DAN9_9BACT|nr:GNAT family N-acetyltransferase [Taibaiella chishuiensis]PSK94294.1 acetyltransferase (GNAT) family protein [Taibaiella chishuiensis]
MHFIPSTPADMPQIFALYDSAIAYQKTKFKRHWQPFDPALISREIAEGRQWKIMIDGHIACIFAIAFEDPFIWGERGSDPAVYLHRIVTRPGFKGNNYVRSIIAWAKVFCAGRGLRYIRMDTWGDNQELIDYYTQCGFNFLGRITPQATDSLPSHYAGITLSLFEIPV